jgi:hypothetical protein
MPMLPTTTPAPGQRSRPTPPASKVRVVRRLAPRDPSASPRAQSSSHTAPHPAISARIRHFLPPPENPSRIAGHSRRDRRSHEWARDWGLDQGGGPSASRRRWISGVRVAVRLEGHARLCRDTGEIGNTCIRGDGRQRNRRRAHGRETRARPSWGRVGRVGRALDLSRGAEHAQAGRRTDQASAWGRESQEIGS